MSGERPPPVSPVIVTKNAAADLKRCLNSLAGFSDIIVVDSASTDGTKAIAKDYGAKVIPYEWEGGYPKKRQWCLDNLRTRHDWIFFVDADEEVTAPFLDALRNLDWLNEAIGGYFVRARYVVNGKMLRHGLHNNKLCLLHRARCFYPDIEGRAAPLIGDIEGHYQPVLRPGYRSAHIKASINHHAFDDMRGWEDRHRRYAHWEAMMDRQGVRIQEPTFIRKNLKRLFKILPARAIFAFLHSYILKSGWRDGAAGLKLARQRYRYYRMISAVKAGKDLD